MHQGGGLQGVVATLPRETFARKPAQFLVNKWHNGIARGGITATPASKQLGYRVRRGRTQSSP